MALYIVRRLIAGFFVVLGASFIVYMLVANAGDPLAPAYGIRTRSLASGRIASLTAALNLDVNPVVAVLPVAQRRGGLRGRPVRLRHLGHAPISRLATTWSAGC